MLSASKFIRLLDGFFKIKLFFLSDDLTVLLLSSEFEDENDSWFTRLLGPMRQDLSYYFLT